MNLKNPIISGVALALMSISLFSCNPDDELDCVGYAAPAAPVPEASFRVVDKNTGADLFNISGPDRLFFDSLVAVQPCNIATPLKAEQESYDKGGSGGYYFTFSNSRQPVAGENAECFQIYLHWDSNDTDTLEFISRTESSKCGLVYHLDNVLFNGEVTETVDYHYILKK